MRNLAAPFLNTLRLDFEGFDLDEQRVFFCFFEGLIYELNAFGFRCFAASDSVMNAVQLTEKRGRSISVIVGKNGDVRFLSSLVYEGAGIRDCRRRWMDKSSAGGWVRFFQPFVG